MIVAIVGSRGITSYALLLSTIAESGFEVTGVVSGGADGVDTLAKRYAQEAGLYPDNYFEILPNYEKYGRAAPILRNEQIAEKGEAMIALWDGKSRGTHDALKRARRLNKLRYVKII